MNYRLIIFDFDGTLGDSFGWAAGVVNHFADQYGFRRIDAHEHDSLRVLDAKTLIQQLGVPAWKIPIMAVHVRKLMAQQIDQIPLFAGIDEQLRCLAASGAILAAVSSNSEDNIRKVLGPENSALFSYFECGAAIFGKASKLKTVLRKSGIAPAQAILIGDEIRDSHAAEQVQMAYGAVAWGYTKFEALLAHNPALAFGSVEELCEKLLGDPS